MTGLLASVSNLQEALLAHQCGVDIIDLKQPAHGALGALSPDEITRIVAALPETTTLSATIGDLPMQADVVSAAVQTMAATGVAYIKIGFFPGGDWQGCLNALSKLSQQHKLIAVLFADCPSDFSVIAAVRHAGFRGVMLDTMNKGAGSLTQWLSPERLSEFTRTARRHDLLTGLAGSLRQADIAGLLPLKPDYLGFRGALCNHHQRTASLEPMQILAIRDCLANALKPQFFDVELSSETD